MTRRLAVSLLVALLAPTAALACAMPRHVEAKALANVMAEIDAADAPAVGHAPAVVTATPVVPASAIVAAPVQVSQAAPSIHSAESRSRMIPMAMAPSSQIAEVDAARSE
ncbi:MAG: hypothetical protein Q8P18_27405 [Pseudomonadota bacterium]|nr:hypothetical protein [Pseudomonadota bacterium]